MQEFEEKRVKQIRDKTHLAAWYPFKEELVIQWKDHPFFIVSYGGGQFNKFCIVGMDKKQSALKCKNTHQPNQPVHLVHVQMVEKELLKLGLKLHNKTISPATDLFLPSAFQDTTKSLTKPISQHPIQLKTAAELHLIRQKLHQDSASIPTSFTPKSHPEFCKCETTTLNPDNTHQVHYNTTYKLTPDPIKKKQPYGYPMDLLSPTELLMYGGVRTKTHLAMYFMMDMVMESSTTPIPQWFLILFYWSFYSVLLLGKFTNKELRECSNYLQERTNI